MADAKRLDPPLLPKGETNEEAPLDQLRIRKLPVQLLLEGIVGNLGVPDDGAGIGERGLLALGEFVRVRKVQ